MCRRLLEAGHSLRVWNRTRAKADTLGPHGAVVCSNAAEAIDGAEYVFCMLDTGAVIDRVMFDSAGAAVDEMADNAVLTVMSSIPVATALRQAAHLAARGAYYVDAPVSGGERGALSGTLTIMAGGDIAVVERVRPLLETLGRLTRVGPIGTGQLTKLANQAIVAITIGAVSEAFALARRGGADLSQVRAALLGGFADSEVLRQHGERMLERSFAPGARAEIQLKDLCTASALASELGIDLPLLRVAGNQFQRLCDSGHRRLDHSALYLLWEQAVG